MSTSASEINKLAVIGAGNMGSGIAQKIASEGFEVTAGRPGRRQRRSRPRHRSARPSHEGVERKLFRPEQAEAILGRVKWHHPLVEDLADVDLVIEAVFEDLEVKKSVSSASWTRCASRARCWRPTPRRSSSK